MTEFGVFRPFYKELTPSFFHLSLFPVGRKDFTPEANGARSVGVKNFKKANVGKLENLPQNYFAACPARA
jgi:hypothetical protein